MSLAKSCAAWVRHTLAWSNSRQSWIERFCALGLVAAGIAVWLGTSQFSLEATLTLWGLLGLATVALLRRGWLKLFGPVLFYDMIRAARRGRYFLLRCCYAGLLLFILFCVWLNAGFYGSDHRQAAYMALRFFEAFMMVQLIAVSILTPAFVAGSISEEKDRKTMEFLLATDLRNREIVLSKFGSRVANLTLFILTGFPILGLIQFLGGVDPTLVLTGFAATGMTMLGLAGLSILNSVLFKRPRDAIAITYLYLISYLGLGFFGWVLQKSGGISYIDFPIWFGDGAPTFSSLITWLNSGNILLTIIEVGGVGSSAAPALLESYALFHGIVALVCVIWATVRLRQVALRQAFAAIPTAGARHKSRAPVGDLPMLWKEVSVEGGLRINWVAAILLAILFLLTLAPGVWMIIEHYIESMGGGPWDWFSRSMNIWVRMAGTFVACLTILGVAVRASTSIGNERDKQTLDSLLTSPMDSSTMLWAKFIGTILSVRLAWIWLGIIWGLGIFTGGLHIFALPLVLAAWFVYASFFTMLGLWFSMTARTTMRATVYTMLSTIGLAVGHWLIWACCGPLLYFGASGGGERVAEYLSKFQAGMTPPFCLGIFAFTGEDFSRQWGPPREMAELIGFSILGLFIWGVAALFFWFALLSPRFRSFTGREEERYPELDYYPREPDEEEKPLRGPPPIPE